MNIFGKSVTELLDLISKKVVSSEELFKYFRKRVQKYNSQLNAFITLNESRVKGLPMGVKDNYCTKGIRTTASSKVLDNFIPSYESTVTSRLLNKGFSILGKTNMDAWAHGSSTETSDFGVTVNPWDVSRVSGGSSGGSAASVISYMSPFAMGSETAGSIRGPAAWCGLIGLKPTYGRVSRYGLIAMGSSLDCPGPLTLSVEDAALILGIIAGHDPYDATSSRIEVPDYTTMLKKPVKLTIGFAEEYLSGCQNDVKTLILKSIEVYKKLGHKIKKIKLLNPKYVISVYTIIQRSEVSSNLSRYDGIRFGYDRSFFGEEAKRRIMLGTYTLSYGYYDQYYKKAQKVRTLIIEDFKKTMKDVDVIIAPTMPSTALKIGEYAKHPFFGEIADVLTEPAALAGLPAISLPVGLDKNNLPVGMQIMGKYFEEGKILNLAYQFEKETNFFGVIKKGLDRYKN